MYIKVRITQERVKVHWVQLGSMVFHSSKLSIARQLIFLFVSGPAGLT